MAEVANSPLAPHLVTWGGAGFNPYEVFASAAAVPVPDAGGVPSVPAVPASPADGGKAVSPTVNPNEENLRTLRENHDRYKAETEQWNKLGTKPDEVEPIWKAAQAVRNDYAAVAKHLGYDDADFAAAFKSNPFKCVEVLKQEYAAAQREGRGRPTNVEDLVKQTLNKELAPIRQREVEQQAREANQRFDTEVDRLFKADKDFDGLPDDVRNLLYDATSEMLKYDNDALNGLREGKVALVQKYYNDAKTVITKAFTAWQAHLNKGGGVRTPAAPAPGAKKLSLDDIITGSDAATAALGSLRS